MKKYSIYIDEVLIANGLTAEEVYLMGFSKTSSTNLADATNITVKIIEE